MKTKIKEFLLKNKPSPLKLLHKSLGFAYAKRGWTFHERNKGDRVLGFWQSKSQKDCQRKVFIVPGFGDTPITWLHLLEALRLKKRFKNYQFFVLDYPGNPGFIPHREAYHDFGLLTQDFMDLMKEVKPTHLFGHSLGGWLVGLYALQENQVLTSQLEKVVFMNSAGVFLSEDHATEIRNLFKAEAGGQIEELRAKVFHKAPKLNLGFIMNEATQIMRKSKAVELLDQIDASYLMEEKLKLSGLKFKTALIWGEFEGLYPIRIIEEKWKKLLPQSSVHILKECSHCFQLEKPVQVYKAMAEELD